jgi:hypothetical protein
VVVPWQWPNAFEGVTDSDLRKVQDAVANGRWRENTQAKNWVGLAIAKALDLELEKKAHKAKIVTLLKKWIEGGVLRVVEGEDARRNKRPFVEVGEQASD